MSHENEVFILPLECRNNDEFAYYVANKPYNKNHLLTYFDIDKNIHRETIILNEDTNILTDISNSVLQLPALPPKIHVTNQASNEDHIIPNSDIDNTIYRETNIKTNMNEDTNINIIIKIYKYLLYLSKLPNVVCRKV